MSVLMQADGYHVLACILAGFDNYRVDGMYVEYGREPETTAITKDKKYFTRLTGDKGFIRTNITGARVGKDNTVVYTAMLSPDDLEYIPEGCQLTSATLVCKRADMVEDLLICTVTFKEPVKVLKNSYITVNASLAWGV